MSNQSAQQCEEAKGRRGGRPESRQSDEMLRRNVGDEKRRADGEPADIAASEEVIFGSPFLSRKIETDPEYDGEVDSDDDQVDCFERPVGNRNRRCEEHPGLLGAAAVEPAPAYRHNGIFRHSYKGFAAVPAATLLLYPFGNAPDACVVKDGDCEVYNRLIPVSMPV